MALENYLQKFNFNYVLNPLYTRLNFNKSQLCCDSSIQMVSLSNFDNCHNSGKLMMQNSFFHSKNSLRKMNFQDISLKKYA